MEVNVLKYPAIVHELGSEDGGGFVVEIPDLPGCIAEGSTVDEALQLAERAADEWILTAKKLKRSIPEPRTIDQFSGKWVQRVPKTLHMKLATEAKREGVSLNALATTLLAEGVGRKQSAA
jgi:antitoxin HicB